jgi:uncharacterized protein YggU (UPF0235/DUF167 family)/vacuolar-type H+-ATPase subunit H
VADSFETVWRERAELGERVHVLETEVARHVELETLLRSTLVSAERAAQDMKEQARREADVIVQEASAERPPLLRDAIAEKEQLLAETHRIRTMLGAALEIVSDGRPRRTRPSSARSRPAEPAEAGSSASPDSRPTCAHYPSGVGRRFRRNARRARAARPGFVSASSPGARSSAVVGRLGDAWKLRVRSRPSGAGERRGHALLARRLRLSARDVRIVSGHTSRDKLVELDRLTIEDVERRLSSGKDDIA